MMNVKTEILQKLRETEQNYNVKIPLAIESGSRGWGFASPDSDYDCRFVYVHQKDWYLSVFDKKDIIEYAVDGLFDVNGWDVKKFLQHIIKSNAVMLEWLSSNEIYINDEVVTKQLRILAKEFFNPIGVSYHYLSIATNKLNEILSEECAKIKKYFYVLRPIANLQYIHQYGKMPYMEYDRTLSDLDIPSKIELAIRELKDIKMVSDESYQISLNKQLIQYFQDEIAFYAKHLKEMKFNKNREYEKVDVVFKDIVEKVWHNE